MNQMPEYHQSGIGMFLRCPRQFMFRYAMNLVVAPKAALTLGAAVDTGTTANYKQKIDSKADLKVDEVLDIYSSDFDQRSVGTDWDGEDSGKQKDLGAKCIKFFHQNAAPKIQPVLVQEAFRIETDAGYAIGGTMDLIDDKKIIRDTKTSAKSYQEDAVSTSIQAATYDFAYEAKFGEKASAFAFDVVTKTKEPKYQEIKGEVSEVQRLQLFETVQLMHSSIKRGEFQYADPGSWVCSKDWCGYWHMCRGKK